MYILRKFPSRILSIFLCVTIICSSFILNSNNFVFSTEVSNLNVLKKSVKKDSFSEKHPIFFKIIKYLGITSGTITAAMVVYYVGCFILDKIDPDRVINRNNKKVAREQLKIVNKDLLDYASKKKSLEKEQVKELQETKASLESIINYKEGSVENAILGIAGIGGAVTVLKYGADLIKFLGSCAKNIFNISYLRFASGNFINMYKETLELFKPPPKGTDKETALQSFDRIFKNFYGQEEAILTLKSHLYDIVVAKDQVKWRGKKYSHCDVIYLYGPSGVGKSFIAKRLPCVLIKNCEPLIVSSSDVDKEKEESVVDQLFNSTSKSCENSSRITPIKPLIKYLKKNPGGVVIFEEYDKFCTPALDEVFRTAIEQGTINIDGEKIDCSGTTFIFTSNEDDVSMEGFEKTDEDKLGKQSVREGYTRVWHSKSFLNRIKKVRFKNLTAKEYEKIMKNHFNETIAYWEDPQNAGIKLNIDNKILEELSKKVEEINQGARPIDLWIIPEIQMSLGDKIKSAPDYDFYRNKSFSVVYDSQNKKIQVVNEP